LIPSRIFLGSLAGAVGDVGNAEPHPAFSKDCGKARASQRGFP